MRSKAGSKTGYEGAERVEFASRPSIGLPWDGLIQEHYISKDNYLLLIAQSQENWQPPWSGASRAPWMLAAALVIASPRLDLPAHLQCTPDLYAKVRSVNACDRDRNNVREEQYLLRDKVYTLCAYRLASLQPWHVAGPRLLVCILLPCKLPVKQGVALLVDAAVAADTLGTPLKLLREKGRTKTVRMQASILPTKLTTGKWRFV